MTKTRLIAILFLTPIIVYAACLTAGFVYDDNVQVLKNPWITDLRHIPDILFSSVLSFAGDIQAANFYRPVFYLVFLAEHMVFGFTPWGWHLTNMLLHSVNAVMVFIVVSGLTEKKNGSMAKPSDSLIPFLSGLFFALHPASSEVVSWVSAVPELTYTLFLLISFYLYLRFDLSDAGSGKAFFVLSVAFYLMALFSKETAVVLPAIIAAYEISVRGSGAIKNWKRFIPYALMVPVYVAARIHALGAFVPYKETNVTPYETLWNVLPLLGRYFGKLLFPAGLSAIYTFHPVASLLSAEMLTGLALFIIYLAALILTRKNRVVFVGLSAIALPLLPALYVSAVSTGGFADRYLYFSTIGFAIVLANIFKRALSRAEPWQEGPEKGKKAVVIAIAVVLAIYAAADIKRSLVWRDDYSLWTDAVEKSPDNANAHYNLAWKLHTMGEKERAVAEYEAALRIDPSKSKARYNLATLYQTLGDNSKAILHYREYTRNNPSNQAAYYNLAMAYQLSGDLPDAIESYKEAIRLNPGYEDARYNLAMALEGAGYRNEAIEQFIEVIRSNPRSFDARFNLGLLYAREGHKEEAAREFMEVLNIRPDYAPARLELDKLANARGTQKRHVR